MTFDREWSDARTALEAPAPPRYAIILAGDYLEAERERLLLNLPRHRVRFVQGEDSFNGMHMLAKDVDIVITPRFYGRDDADAILAVLPTIFPGWVDPRA